MALPLFIAGAAGLLALLAGCDKPGGRAKDKQKSSQKDDDLDAGTLPKPVIVTDMYWSATESYSKIESEGSYNSFYVDLNLHVVTEIYFRFATEDYRDDVEDDDGVLESITIRNGDGEELYDGNKSFDPTTMNKPPIRINNGKEVVYVFKNVLKELKLKMGRDNPNMTIVAEHNESKIEAKITIVKPRPRWVDVFDGYPKKIENNRWNDILADEVFKMVLGERYNKKIFYNACATRVSLGLLNAGIDIPKDPMKGVGIGQGVIKVQNKPMYCITSAQCLQIWLKQIWGRPDVEVWEKYPYDAVAFNSVETKIGTRHGIFIIVFSSTEFSSTEFSSIRITGHATLWDGEFGMIGGSPIMIKEVKQKYYFWELK
jgi:hypothetical protein